MTKKTKVIVAGILVIILIVAGYFLFFTSKSNRLTVTDIHDNVVYGKTTKKDLENRYGKPKKVNKNIGKVNEIYKYWKGYEGGVNYYLEANTDYWSTTQGEKSAPKRGYNDNFRYYLEYSGKKLGTNYVRFFFWRDTVYGIQFGNKITNESAAKRDKYLKQIYGD